MLNITGDINLTDGYFDIGYGVGNSLKNGEDPFRNIIRNKEDIWIGNFEGVVSNCSNKCGIARKSFIVNSEYIKHINHFDYYCVANNHSMQHGAKAFEEMKQHFNSMGVKYFGSIDRKSILFTHQNKKISISSFSQRIENFDKPSGYWYNPELYEIQNEYDNLVNVDFKIVYVHWGNEFINYPYADQKYFAHWLIDLGYDIVIGMHPHIIQGFEIYKEKYIFYSLGNFVFNMPWEPLQYGALVNIDLSNDTVKVKYNYVKIQKDYFPIIVNENDIPKHYRFENLNKLIKRNIVNESYYEAVTSCMKKYRKSNYLNIVRNFYKYNFTIIASIMFDFVKRKLKM